jgi:hypothetical protein
MIDETTKGSAARKASHCCSKSGNRTRQLRPELEVPTLPGNPASVFLTLGYVRASTVESNGSTEKGRYSGSETPQPIRKCPPDPSLVHPSRKRFKSDEQWEVLRRGGRICHRRKGRRQKQFPLEQTGKSSVFEQEKITLSVGDRIRFTKNVQHRGQKFLNNELRTVVSIDDDRIIFDKGEIVRIGAALHLDQGLAVTSHASQAKTVDQFIVSVPVRAFSQANEAQFYVSMSRSLGSAPAGISATKKHSVFIGHLGPSSSQVRRY